MHICDCVFSDTVIRQPCKLTHYAHLRFSRVWENDEHIHALCEIAYILSGAGEYVYNGVAIPAKPGDLFITNAYTPHYERSGPDAPLDHIFFSINIGGFEEKTAPDTHDRFLLRILDKPAEKILHYNFSEFLPYFTELAKTFDDEIAKKPPLWQQDIQCRFQLALILILRHTALQQSAQVLPNANKNERIPHAVASFLDSNFTFEHSLDELSERFFISKSYLLASFKKTYGVSPMQYLNKARIHEAQRTLQTTDFPVSTVAAQTGFANASHFARVYKQYTGITPSQEIEKARRSRQNKSD